MLKIFSVVLKDNLNIYEDRNVEIDLLYVWFIYLILFFKLFKGYFFY